MHYKNGREAKNGDKVVLFPSYRAPVAGILYDAVAGNDYCNGKIASTSTNDPCPNLKEVLHYDDVKRLAFEERLMPSDDPAPQHGVSTPLQSRGSRDFS